MATHIDIAGKAVRGIATWRALFGQIAEISRDEDGEFELIIVRSPEGPIPLGTQDEELAWDRATDALIERGIGDAPWGFYSVGTDLWFISRGGAFKCNGAVLQDRLEHPERWRSPDGGCWSWSWNDEGPLHGAGHPDPGPEYAIRDPYLALYRREVWAQVGAQIKRALKEATGCSWEFADFARLVRAMVWDEMEEADPDEFAGVW